MSLRDLNPLLVGMEMNVSHYGNQYEVLKNIKAITEGPAAALLGPKAAQHRDTLGTRARGNMIHISQAA